MMLLMFSLTIGGLCQDDATAVTDSMRGDGDPIATSVPAEDSQTPIEISAPTDLPAPGEWFKLKCFALDSCASFRLCLNAPWICTMILCK